MTDFANLDTVSASNEGAILELRGPDGAALFQEDGSPITITLLGPDSDAYTQASNILTNRALRSRGKAQITAESALTDQISLLAKITTAWAGIKVAGETWTCNSENVKRFYRAYPFVRDQVQEFVADRGNFLKASPTS